MSKCRSFQHPFHPLFLLPVQLMSSRKNNTDGRSEQSAKVDRVLIYDESKRNQISFSNMY